MDYRGKRYYAAKLLYQHREGGQGEEHPAEEEHGRDEQAEVVVEAVN